MAEGKCKSCNAPVIWSKFQGSGKNGIFDSNFSLGGTGYEITPDGARYVKDADKSVRVYTSHWATCPNAKKHREEVKQKQMQMNLGDDA